MRPLHAFRIPRTVPSRAGLLLALLLPTLGACTLQPTPYQPLDKAGGYEQSRLQERVYRVSFRGNRATRETTVLDFLFLRCAELTRESGFTHFVVEQDFGRTQLELHSTGVSSSVGVGMGFGGRRSFWALGVGAPLSAPDYEAAVSYHLAVFVIRMLTPDEARALEAGKGQGQVYEAAYLLHSLEAKKEASLRKPE